MGIPQEDLESSGWVLESVPCGFHRWRGDYGGKKQLWFPSNYVEEMINPAILEPEREVCLETQCHRFVSLTPGSLLMCLSHPGLPVICEPHILCGHTLVSIVRMSCLAGREYTKDSQTSSQLSVQQPC